MRRRFVAVLVILLAVTIGVLLWYASDSTVPSINSSSNELSREISFTPPSSLPFPNNASGFVAPLDRAAERVTKKFFGLKVSPTDSPVSPERFTGFHTGVDFEIFDEELNTPVSVQASCGGTLKLKRQATGYGGVVVQECLLGDQPVTVVYGHLKLSSVTATVGEYVVAGTRLGLLGAGGSPETDGERKHLHLGIHKGTAVDLKGYVGSVEDLANWLDPMQYLP